MTLDRSSPSAAPIFASRPLTDRELEERYGRGLRRSDDWFELYEEPQVDVPLPARRKYLVPLVGALVVAAAVLTGYALQKNEWRALSSARDSLREAFRPELPPMKMESLEERDRVDYRGRLRHGLVVRLSTALAEASYEREQVDADAAAPAKDARTKPAPRPPQRRAAPPPAQPEPAGPEPERESEGSRVIEAPMDLPVESEPDDDAGSRSIEAPFEPEPRDPAPDQVEPEAPVEPDDPVEPGAEPNPYERSTPRSSDYGI